jgi:hypothetical protein
MQRRSGAAHHPWQVSVSREALDAALRCSIVRSNVAAAATTVAVRRRNRIRRKCDSPEHDVLARVPRRLPQARAARGESS